MASKEYKPDFVGTVTKYVFVESPDVTPQHLAIRAYEISHGVMIKETCFGLQITGMPEEVKGIIKELRKIDPAHILVKDRGFPPGDPRRCRANLGGARPGYYGHEFEMKLLRYISKGFLKDYAGERATPDAIKGIGKDEAEKLPVDKLLKIIKSEES
ncbi:methanogenesis marker 6 protein [Methanomicrobium antiquum]|uniref:Methanogenesis marker 6 protein n=1 Tax=Methanomicrobium antiquum TaxID=487686 RepID=A0AAF0FNK3_9EURY|nr:methanogenesis marker 6 protein [Methanomicrobium antiquum]MDD3977552.1 methanogenesis marker 6 protein [Methanomicrobium sp.]WFN35864.1 methanogenesis marker 6 protein [Methanomicrobium antiquum]